MTSKVKSVQDITKTFLLPAETSHFAEQTWIPAPRHAGIPHAEEKPQQKEGSLWFCASPHSSPGKEEVFLEIVENSYA